MYNFSKIHTNESGLEWNCVLTSGEWHWIKLEKNAAYINTDKKSQEYNTIETITLVNKIFFQMCFIWF